MKRIVLLTTLASMLAASMALSGVAQASPVTNTKADTKCLAEAVRTLQPGFKPSDYNFVGGTENIDNLTGASATDGPDVVCGFGGDDFIRTSDDGGYIFLGGEGDHVDLNFGTFYGGDGTDSVLINWLGGTISSVEQVGEQVG